MLKIEAKDGTLVPKLQRLRVVPGLIETRWTRMEQAGHQHLSWLVQGLSSAALGLPSLDALEGGPLRQNRHCLVCWPANVDGLPGANLAGPSLRHWPCRSRPARPPAS
jgi:hypothetical protein